MSTLDNSAVCGYAVWAVGHSGPDALHAVFLSEAQAILEVTSCNEESVCYEYRVAPVTLVL